MRTCVVFRFVRLALMIEGQEGVTWDDWVALASACEEHGVEALFRSDHYVSGFDEKPSRRSTPGRRSAGLAARTTKLELGTLVSPATFRHPAVLARSAADGRRDLRRPRHARHGRRLDGARTRGVRIRVRDNARAGRTARGAARDRARPPPRGPRRLRGHVLQARGRARASAVRSCRSSSAAAPSPAPPGPRSGSPTNTTPCSARSTRPASASNCSTKPASVAAATPPPCATR